MTEFWSDMANRAEPYRPGEQLGEDYLKLNTNENPYPPSPAVTTAISNEMERKLRLYPSPTVDKLREQIAEQHQLNKEHVFAGNGSDEVLAFAFMAFFTPTKPIRFPTISYSFYPTYAKLFNIPYESVALKDDFTIEPKTFFQSEGGVIFPNPNAPTGIYLDLNAVQAIVEENPTSVVIVDEAYIDFAGDSAATLLPNYKNLLVVQTMSKSRSLAGLRVGFALGDPSLIEALTRVKNSFNSYTIDRLAIAGAQAALTDHAYFTEHVQLIIKTREWASLQLEQLGFSVLPSQANFLFVQHPSISGQVLYEELKQHHILVRHFAKPHIAHHVRITIGTREEMTTLLSTLATIINT